MYWECHILESLNLMPAWEQCPSCHELEEGLNQRVMFQQQPPVVVDSHYLLEVGGVEPGMKLYQIC